jgi:hypothetical protein
MDQLWLSLILIIILSIILGMGFNLGSVALPLRHSVEGRVLPIRRTSRLYCGVIGVTLL